ncbi:MAG: RecQ family ATP-dependent DNA helicase, partial [Acutalibacteraceae bacterium]
AIGSLEISMVCVDEAHCVSQWGQDFRPSYLLVKDFIESFETRPVVCAMTATATEKVRNDIIKLIGLKNPDITVLSFDRKNLYFSCQKPKSKPKELRRLLDLYSGRSGIVYCSSRKRTDSLFEQLSQEGYSVTKYHAGMPPHERKRNQELFINDEKDIIIATNAFGMGIDKSNVSFVIHYNMPGDIESYYQEAGRAGRDGNRADCILLYNGSDINTQKYFIDNPEDNGELSIREKSFLRKTRLQKLEAMISYTKSQTCLRQYILSYFGETAPDHCGNCSVCREAEAQRDITVDAQKIMSCIARVKQSENATVVSDILLGNSSETISKNGYDKLSTYGIMSGFSNEKLASLIEYLLSASYIDKKDGLLVLTAKSKDVLFGKKHITMQKETQKTSKNKIQQDTEFDKELFERLRILRKKIADKRKVPAFVIFTDATLIAISKYKPRTEEQFLEVPGVGSYKLQNFGAVFIKEICDYLDNA